MPHLFLNVCTQALGLKPKTVAKPAPQLDKHELDEIIHGKREDREAAAAAGGEGGPGASEAGAGAGVTGEADRIKGLGFIAG